MTKGLAKATVVDPWSRYDNSDWKDLAEVSGPLFSTDFEPIIGILAASNNYWNRLSESEKQAWKRAADEASVFSHAEIKMNEAVASSNYSKIRPISIGEKERYNLIYYYGSTEPRVTNDLRVIEEARSKIELSEAQKKKK